MPSSACAPCVRHGGRVRRIGRSAESVAYQFGATRRSSDYEEQETGVTTSWMA